CSVLSPVDWFNVATRATTADALAATHYFILCCDGHHRHLHSFPTRRSSDLGSLHCGRLRGHDHATAERRHVRLGGHAVGELPGLDRKSTRLNSSHRTTSYAVFCLKKKMQQLAHRTETISTTHAFFRYLKCRT